MAECNGQGIGRIEVLGRKLHLQRLFQHHLHLFLGSGTVADDGFLGLAGRVLAAIMAAPWARPSFRTTWAFLP